MGPANMNNSTVGSTALPYSVHEVDLEGRIHLTSKYRSHFRFMQDSGLCTSSLQPQYSHPWLIKPNGLWFCFNMLAPNCSKRSKCTSCPAACAPLTAWGVVISCRNMAKVDYCLSCSYIYCRVRSAVPITTSPTLGTEGASRNPLEWGMGQKQSTRLLLTFCFCKAKLKYVLFCGTLWAKPQWNYCQPSLILFIL